MSDRDQTHDKTGSSLGQYIRNGGMMIVIAAGTSAATTTVMKEVERQRMDLLENRVQVIEGLIRNRFTKTFEEVDRDLRRIETEIRTDLMRATRPEVVRPDAMTGERGDHLEFRIAKLEQYQEEVFKLFATTIRGILQDRRMEDDKR